jgi:hypothetical protein
MENLTAPKAILFGLGLIANAFKNRKNETVSL